MWPDATVWWQLLLITLGTSGLMSVLWVVQRMIGNAGVVDVGWSFSLALAAVYCAIAGDGDPMRRAIVGTIGAVWGLRLAWHLLTDRVIPGHEDGRYTMMRETLGKRFQPVLFLFFQAQAVTVGVLAIPFALACSARIASPSVADIAAICVWITGLVGESVADSQLKAFKANPANRGGVCDRGMWRYSRHPNYFFEWCMWIAYAIIAWQADAGWLGLIGPLIIYVLVRHLTGIPPTEARSVRSRGEAYRRYQRTTSSFFPWFPSQGPRVEAPTTPEDESIQS